VSGNRNYSFIITLLIGIAVGSAMGFINNAILMQIVVSIKYVLGQFICYTIPLVIIGFVAPAIKKLGKNASKMLVATIVLAYISSVGASVMASTAGYILIPRLSVPSNVVGLQVLPEAIFQLDIPQIMPVMTALVTAIILGIATVWTGAAMLDKLLDEFEVIIMQVIKRLIIPILPIFIAVTFAALAYEGGLTRQLPVFGKLIVIILIGHMIWLVVLYTIGGIVARRNPFEVLRHYSPAYLTAIGTMSSAATLPVSLSCAGRSRVLSKSTVEFVIPLGATVHLPGSVLTEIFFIMTINMMLYGSLPSIGTMVLFIALFGLFAIGAPGIPGGTVMASLGLVTGVLGFDSSGVAILLAIFALQDSFGTACNVTGDGAIALMIEGLFREYNNTANSDMV
jgi:Na+/H+-dicarboxylate symporter